MKIMKLPIVQLSPSPVTSSLLGPNILLFLNVRDQVSHPYKTTGRIMVLCILTFTFLESRREDRRLNRMVASVPRIQSAVNLLVHATSIC
jgi:hypothetical protein